MNTQKVVLVDKDDNKLGMSEVMSAHLGQGQLHRAVSVLLFRFAGGEPEILLQKRSSTKPLWPLYWTNTICTHPRDKETYAACAIRRLKEEMGIEFPFNRLKFVYRLLYRAKYSDDLSENELDSVFAGMWDGIPQINPKEAAGYRWERLDQIKNAVKQNQLEVTPWFKLMLKDSRIEKSLHQNKL